jgi:hypothetical protein
MSSSNTEEIIIDVRFANTRFGPEVAKGSSLAAPISLWISPDQTTFTNRPRAVKSPD